MHGRRDELRADREHVPGRVPGVHEDVQVLRLAGAAGVLQAVVKYPTNVDFFEIFAEPATNFGEMFSER